MDTGIPNLQLNGELVTIHTPAARKVGQGKFCLENREGASFRATINVAWLEFGSGRQVLVSDLTVSDRERDLPLNPERFTVEAQASLPFQIDFVEPAYEPGWGECTAVGLRLEVGGTELEALSPVEFVRG